MSAFDRTDTSAEGLFELSEFDSTGEEGQLEVELPIHPDAVAVTVMFEGFGLEMTDINIDGSSLADDTFSGEDNSPVRRLYLGVRDKMKTLRFWVRTNGKNAKITVLRILRHIGKDFKKRLSCTTCKRLVRFLLIWIMSGFHIPHVPLHGPIPPSAWGKLKSILSLDTSKYPSIVAQLLSAFPPGLLDRLIEALRWASDFVDQMYEPIDLLVDFRSS